MWLSQTPKKGRLNICEKSHRTQSNVGSQIVFDCFYVLRQGGEHDERALTVTDVVDFSLGAFRDVLEGGRQVVGDHLVKGEVPEVLDRWTEFRVAVSIPSDVADPDVVACVGEDKSRGIFLFIYNPCIR